MSGRRFHERGDSKRSVFRLIAAISATCVEAEVQNKDGGGRRVRTGSEQQVLALSVNTPPVSAELHAARADECRSGHALCGPVPMGTALIASSLFLCSLANVAAAGALTDGGGGGV